MVKYLFLDLDDTILDFHKAEGIALGKTLEFFGLTPCQPVRERYRVINLAHWQALERKEMTRPQVLTGRFRQLFEEYHIAADCVAAAGKYEEFLSIGHYFLPGAEAALQSLSRKYSLYLASNGTARVQAGRLKSANISHYFREIFVSEELGADKPDILFFERAAQKIPGFDARCAMMVGDSLTSDISGGIRAGMTTVWVNPEHKPHPEHIRPDYQIEALSQLEDLLEKL